MSQATTAAAGSSVRGHGDHAGVLSNLSLIGFLEFLDSKAQSYPLMINIASKVGCRPGVVISIVLGFLLCSLIFGWGGGLICDLVGFLYPAWMSFKAIETPAREDDKLWLTYWVVYAFFSIVEYFIDSILFWLPFYYVIKLGFLLYLCLPWTKGAEVVYNAFVRPQLVKHQSAIEGAVSSLGAVGSQMTEAASSVVNDGLDLVNQAAGAVKKVNQATSQNRTRRREE
eukprot:GHVQ01012947.1.p1 GENE.GHVQ01012947.1~~GHVQ01012947.1.p1  ORF type:complete len:227 (+),score=11.69 GHVQ01012947.1:497-1177(+)